MDELDHKLIKELLRNAELSNTELSTKLGVNEKTVRRRIRHLVEHGIINRVIIMDPVKLGYDVRAFIILEVDLNSLDSVISSLNGFSNIDFVSTCTGQIDILLGAWFHSSREMADFVKNHLSKISGIRRTQTIIVLDTKQNKAAPIDLSDIPPITTAT
jgi:Lrp/AsnC family transcriptional regulator, regulator for asnA, asnC and gidA